MQSFARVLLGILCLTSSARAADALAIARLAVAANHGCTDCIVVTGLEREKRQERLRLMVPRLIASTAETRKLMHQLKLSFNASFSADDAGAEKLLKAAMTAVYQQSPEPDLFDFAARYLVVGLREGQAKGYVPTTSIPGTYSILGQTGSTSVLVIKEDYEIAFDGAAFSPPSDLRFSRALLPEKCSATYDFGYGKRTFVITAYKELELAFPAEGKLQLIYKEPTQCLTKPQMYDTERDAGYWKITEHRLEGELKR